MPVHLVSVGCVVPMHLISIGYVGPMQLTSQFIETTTNKRYFLDGRVTLGCHDVTVVEGGRKRALELGTLRVHGLLQLGADRQCCHKVLANVSKLNEQIIADGRSYANLIVCRLLKPHDAGLGGLASCADVLSMGIIRSCRYLRDTFVEPRAELLEILSSYIDRHWSGSCD